MGNLSEIARICLSTNALVTGIVTIGLITIITYFAFTLEKKISESSPFFEKVVVDLLEMGVLLLGALIVEQVFESLTGGSTIELGGLYANAELTLLFYCLFVFNNPLIVLLNIALPFIYHPSFDVERMTGPYWPLFLITYISLVIVIDFLYKHKDELIISSYKYLASQVIFGVCWWIIIWLDYRFPVPDIVGMLIVFEIYMFVVRVIEQQMSKYMHAFDDLQLKANYDALTGVRNRANLVKLSKEAYEKYSVETNKQLTVVMFDIDRFKNFNDKYGHEIGDEVLRHVAHIVERELHMDGSHGKLFRYGGEEFVILMPEAGSSSCTKIINNINDTLIEMPLFMKDIRLDVTLCFGVTTLRPTDRSFEEIFKRVDQYLYESKNNGRNKMTVEGKVEEYDKHRISHA